MGDQTDNKLKELRGRIDEIDEQLESLVSERARCAQAIAEAKQGDGRGADCYRPEREAEILRRVKERNAGPLSDEAMLRLFREIMSACLALQTPPRIAFLGPAGTFTQEAATRHFGHSVTSLPLNAIDEVFREVESGNADYGVVPVENSTEGAVNSTLDMFLQSPLRICGEISLRIHHHLLASGGAIDRLERVAAHQQALAQCREWLDANAPAAERVAVSSNAEAARRAGEDPSLGAIAPASAAELYALNVLARNIEDEPYNTTRFLLIGHQNVPASGHDKTTILTATQNRPGALYRLLDPLERHDISMTRIESRPSRRGVWDYVFFIDFEGHADDAHVAEALRELEDVTSLLRVLGSYPAAVE